MRNNRKSKYTHIIWHSASPNLYILNNICRPLVGWKAKTMCSCVIWEILTRNHIRLLSLTHLQPTMCILGLDRGTTWQKLIQLLEDAMAEWCSEVPPRPSDLQGAGSSPAGNWVIFLIDVCFYVICFNWNEYRLDLWRSKALSCLVSMRI